MGLGLLLYAVFNRGMGFLYKTASQASCQGFKSPRPLQRKIRNVRREASHVRDEGLEKPALPSPFLCFVLRAGLANVRETREEQEKQDERELGSAKSRLSSLSRAQARAIGLGCDRKEAL